MNSNSLDPDQTRQGPTFFEARQNVGLDLNRSADDACRCNMYQYKHEGGSFEYQYGLVGKFNEKMYSSLITCYNLITAPRPPTSNYSAL